MPTASARRGRCGSIKTYGSEAVAIISENPYRLARDIRGIGFKTADQIAAKVGIAKDAMVRVRAGVSYALAEAMDEGHCGLPEDDLLRSGAELLEVVADRLTAALALELQDGAVVADTVGERRCIFLAGLYRAEQDIAGRLRTLAAGAPPWPIIDVDKAIPWLEAKGGITLAESQREALRLAVSSKALVITGGPGVGKTTLVNSILKALVAKSVSVALCAPTGRAAKRLTETTGVEAKTIHRLLETDPKNGGFKRDEQNPLACDLLVVDETSMVDVLLMKALMRALPARAALLLVGDVDQLPSVGPGQVLADVIGSGAVPVVRLTEVFRQAATSRVIVNAHRINQGLMPEVDRSPAARSDFYVIEAADPEIAAAKIVAVVRDRIPKAFGLDPIRDVQVLCPMNRGGVGARSLNIELQKVLNPPGEVRVERFGSTYWSGRQGHADRERLRQGGLQRRPRHRGPHRHGSRGPGRHLRWPRGGLWLWGARRAGAGLRHDDPQGAGLGVPGRRDPGHDAALHHAGEKPALHGRHPRQEARGAGRAAKGSGHRGPERRAASEMVEAARVAGSGIDAIAATRNLGRYRIAAASAVMAVAAREARRSGSIW